MNKKHPWSEFLEIRLKVIEWLHDEGRGDENISYILSMDADQVRRIRKAVKYENALKDGYDPPPCNIREHPEKMERWVAHQRYLREKGKTGDG